MNFETQSPEELQRQRQAYEDQLKKESGQKITTYLQDQRTQSLSPEEATVTDAETEDYIRMQLKKYGIETWKEVLDRTQRSTLSYNEKEAIQPDGSKVKESLVSGIIDSKPVELKRIEASTGETRYEGAIKDEKISSELAEKLFTNYFSTALLRSSKIGGKQWEKAEQEGEQMLS
ncbi:MAG: hypothetical protein V1846_01130 [Candidatus Komeilibacteria bacterium]